MRLRISENLLSTWRGWYRQAVLRVHLRSEYLRIGRYASQTPDLWEKGENILLLREIRGMEERRQCS